MIIIKNSSEVSDSERKLLEKECDTYLPFVLAQYDIAGEGTRNQMKKAWFIVEHDGKKKLLVCHPTTNPHERLFAEIVNGSPVRVFSFPVILNGIEEGERYKVNNNIFKFLIVGGYYRDRILKVCDDNPYTKWKVTLKRIKKN